MNQPKETEKLEELIEEREIREEEDNGVYGDNHPVIPIPYHYKEMRIYELKR